MALIIYDPKNVAFMVNGVDYSEELGEDGVKIEKIEAIKKRTSVSGRPLLSKSQEALHSKVTVSVVRGSPLNTVFEQMLNRSEYFSVSMIDMNNKATDNANECVVTKEPDKGFKDDSDLTWELYATYLKSSTVG
jgi:hypothetical protein